MTDHEDADWLRTDMLLPEDGETVLTATLKKSGWEMAIGTVIGGTYFHHLDTTKCMCPQPHLWTCLHLPPDEYQDLADCVQRARDKASYRRRRYHGPNEWD